MEQSLVFMLVPNMRRLLFTLAFVVINSNATAQVGTKVEWNQEAPTLSAAINYRYNLGVNGVWQNSTLFASCSGSKSPYLCTATIPSNIAPGSHKLTLRAVDITDIFQPAPSESSDETDFVKPPPAKPINVVVK